MELPRLMCVWLMCVGAGVWASQNASDTADGGRKVLARKRRFLLFTPGSHILLTASFGKNLMFRNPAGYVVVGELDMYYPLPDYKYQASALRLGGVAMYPPEPQKSPPPPPPPEREPEAHDHHHSGGELTPAEVDQYLQDHPGSWIPPGWGKERADWHESPVQYSSRYWAHDQPQYGKSPTLNRYLGGAGSAAEDPAQSHGRYRRSQEEEHERAKWLSGEAFNISQHREWEHFHHYRDRRALFSQLEETIGAITGMHMKDCILRSICEAKNMLPPPGRSMSMDIFRVLFTFPLHEALEDEYSNALRDETLDCRARYGSGCPMSLLDLVLFGRFEP